MSARRAGFLLALLCTTAVCLAPTHSQITNHIQVTGATVVREAPMRMDQDLPGRLTAVPDHISLWCANVMTRAEMVPILPSFRSALAQIQDRIMTLSPNLRRDERLAYPRAAIKDTVPPVISGVEVTLIGPDSASVAWTTDELADSRVVFRGEPGVPSQTVGDPLYALNHEIILRGLRPGTTYYCTIISTDRSGNTSTSPEHTFYLPSRVKGDVNGDGILSIADVSLALRLSIGLSAPTARDPSAADLDADGRISIGEVTRLLSAAVGLSPL